MENESPLLWLQTQLKYSFAKDGLLNKDRVMLLVKMAIQMEYESMKETIDQSIKYAERVKAMEKRRANGD